MRAYARGQTKRFANKETRDQLSTRAHSPFRSSNRGDLPPFWGRFSRELGVAAEAVKDGQGRALSRLALCGRLDLNRLYSCGTEQFAVPRWCGQAYCWPCAVRRAGKTARYLFDEWNEERLLRVRLASSAGGLSLPTTSRVATLREGWAALVPQLSKRTGFAPLERRPRSVICPDGLTLFMPLPWETTPGVWGQAAEAALLESIVGLGAGVGLAGIQPQVVSKGAGAVGFSRSLLLEAERFKSRVSSELRRVEELSWRESYPGDISQEVARRVATKHWLKRISERNQQARRKVVLGSKTALPVPRATRIQYARRVCPGHGQLCSVRETRVRDNARGGRVFYRLEGDALPKPNRQALQSFFERALRQGQTIRRALPPPIKGRLRKAA